MRFALAERAKFDLMWRYALIDRDDADYKAAADRAFLLLDELVRGRGAPRGESDLDYAPSIACWSMVHGFARLALDGAFGDDSAIADAAVAQLLPLVLDHLDV